MDVNEMMGRTLGDVLESRGNDETLCFIGSASSYFCIGTLAEIDGIIDGISESYRKEYTDTFERLKEELSKIPQKAKYDGKEDLAKYGEKLVKYGEQIISAVKALRRAGKNYETFRPMRDRMIRDAYYKECDNGIAIIVTGQETGKYWTKEEWDRERNKNV